MSDRNPEISIPSGSACSFPRKQRYGQAKTVLLFAQRVSRLAGELREGRHIVDGELGQHFPVDIDSCLFQPVHQDAVGKALCAGCGIDSGDPQAPEVPLFSLPVGVGP